MPQTTDRPTTPTAAQLERDARWAKRLARRARKIERNQATWAEGQQARAERIDQRPGDVAQRFAETQ